MGYFAKQKQIAYSDKGLEMIEAILKRAIEKVARKYALQNAYFHNGKADLNAVTAQIYGHGDEIIRNIVNEIVNEVNKLTLEEQKKQLESMS